MSYYAPGDRVIVDPAPGAACAEQLFPVLVAGRKPEMRYQSAIGFARIRGTVVSVSEAEPPLMARFAVVVDLDQRAVPGALPRTGPPRRLTFAPAALRKLDPIELLGELAWSD